MLRFAQLLPPTLALIVAASVAPIPGVAQNLPKRPQLDNGADTNSALAYYRFGLSVIRVQPEMAGDAFFWAAQIDPTWAQPLYARRIALLLASDDGFLSGYMEGKRGIGRSEQAVRVDSLELRARMLDPFLDRELDAELLRRYIAAVFHSETGQRWALMHNTELDGAATSEFDHFLDSYWRGMAPPFMRAVRAASEKRFPDALSYFHQALAQKNQEAAEIRLARGRIFFLTGDDDSARVEIQLGLEMLRGRDSKDFVYAYESKSVLEHSLGLINERQGQLGRAREAYARALQEDLSYYPAHLHLSVLAMTDGDTTTALNEMDLAAQIRDDDLWVQTAYASLLAQLGHLDEADQHLKRVVTLAPFYAAPYYALGRVAEMAKKPADAAQHYHAFLAHAASQDGRVADARGRLATLEASAQPHQ
jgi:tetratricopeptide (TPR) repeat protein